MMARLSCSVTVDRRLARGVGVPFWTAERETAPAQPRWVWAFDPIAARSGCSSDGTGHNERYEVVVGCPATFTVSLDSAHRASCGRYPMGPPAMICDRGSRLAQDTSSKTFNPFYRTRDYGPGIGGAISQCSIAAHGGRLRAQNPPDCGAAFNSTLPARVVRPSARSPA